MTVGGYIIGLVAREDAGEQLSPAEQRVVDEYWDERAEPMTVEQRQRFIAAAQRGLDYRRQRIDGWRVLLYTVMWWWFGKEPTWHDFFDCTKCHPWPAASWVGPYELGEESGGSMSTDGEGTNDGR